MRQGYIGLSVAGFLITTLLMTFMKRNQRLLMKTKWQRVNQLLMNYQTVVDEVTSPLSPLLAPCHVPASLPSFIEDEEGGGKGEEEENERWRGERGKDRGRGKKRLCMGERTEY